MQDKLKPEFPTGAIINGRGFIERLKNVYDFECQAGRLGNCQDFIELERCFEYMAEYINNSATDKTIEALKDALKEAVRLASDENGEIFNGDLRARETALILWKRQAIAALASVEGV